MTVLRELAEGVDRPAVGGHGLERPLEETLGFIKTTVLAKDFAAVEKGQAEGRVDAEDFSESFEGGPGVRRIDHVPAVGKLGLVKQILRVHVGCKLELNQGLAVAAGLDQRHALVELNNRIQELGFDTETRPAYKKGESYLPSLLQLASDDEVFIFQLKHLGLAKPLCEILADSTIIKAGVSLDYDIRELKKLSHFKAAGFMDLGNLAKKAGIKNHGLRGLAAVFLGERISKGMRTSNWAKDVLTPQQVQYAATDAWVGRRLYLAQEKAA